MNNPLVVILLIALVIVIAVAIWLYTQKRRTEQLRGRFGPEYDRAVEEHQDRRGAEEALQERQERVEHLKLRSLSGKEREQFGQSWRSVQAHFVDEPERATKEADRLVAEVMQT